MKNLVFLVALLIGTQTTVSAQAFVNEDLNGVVMGSSTLPNGWSNVPANDPVCAATVLGVSDTPDLTDLNGPNAWAGLVGNPYSGTTFITGTRSIVNNSQYQEGIMQTVGNFTPNLHYSVNFVQANVKQMNCMDSSGSWAVYVDTTLIGVTTPTFSTEPFNSTNLAWEARSLNFTATSANHTIKFLPIDDDTNFVLNMGMNNNGCIRMGIDSIYLKEYDLSIELGSDIALCEGESLVLDATTAGATYLWQDNSTDPTLTVTQSGTYWSQVTQGGVTVSDTIVVTFDPLPEVDLGDDITICEDDSLKLDVTNANASYLWQDGSTSPTYSSSEASVIWVEVTRGVCTVSDTLVMQEENCEVSLILPNVFTPNGDSKNDLFEPIERVGIASMDTHIFNRWGQEVYQSDKLDIEWQGTLDSRNIPVGGYFWVVNYTDRWGNSGVQKGHLTLLR